MRNMKESKKRYYYLYKITNKKNNYFYIGVHCTNKIRDNYMGSGTAIRKAIKEEGIENFKKEILEYFNNSKELLKREREIVNSEFILRHDTYNIILGGGKLNGLNNVTVKDSYGNKLMVSKNDPRLKNGELIGVSRNTIVVKDKHGKIFRVSKDDPRYLSGELIGSNFGINQKRKKVLARNIEGKSIYVFKDDIRLQIGKLWIRNGKRIWVIDSKKNKFRVYINDPRYLSGELKKVIRKKYNHEEYLKIRRERKLLRKSKSN